MKASDIPALIVAGIFIVIGGLLAIGVGAYALDRAITIGRDVYSGASQRAESILHPPTPTPIPPPTATPDVPRFASGEAIATVKTWLSRKSPTTSATGARDCLQLHDRLMGSIVWQESYIGQGVWWVRHGSSIWKVYEKSLMVDPVEAQVAVGC